MCELSDSFFGIISFYLKAQGRLDVRDHDGNILLVFMRQIFQALRHYGSLVSRIRENSIEPRDQLGIESL